MVTFIRKKSKFNYEIKCHIMPCSTLFSRINSHLLKFYLKYDVHFIFDFLLFKFRFMEWNKI